MVTSISRQTKQSSNSPPCRAAEELCARTTKNKALPRHGHAKPSKSHKPSQRQSEALDPAVLELPNLAVLTNECAQAIREPDRHRERLAKAVDSSMGIISDSAVAVEVVSDENSEVGNMIDREHELTDFA
jgi:hypothetical protein